MSFVFFYNLAIDELYLIYSRFLDLVKDTRNVEYIKLIISCLDYSSAVSFNRRVLQAALTCASVVSFFNYIIQNFMLNSTERYLSCLTILIQTSLIFFCH